MPAAPETSAKPSSEGLETSAKPSSAGLETSPKPSSAGLAPERSLTQRMDALARANEIRTRRARLKRELKAGRVAIHGLLLDPPDYLQTAKVFDLLLAVPKYGRVKVNRVLTPLPHLAEQDHRRPLSAPAQRAGGLPAPIAPPVLVITGPSGVGKGTLIRGLLERMPGLRLAVSATTRRARAGERDGSDYWFLEPQEFERRVGRGDFVEHAEYAGNRYGTLRSELERPAEGIVLEIDVQGARQVRETLPEATQVFIAPPSLEVLRERLEARGSDSSEQVRVRLAEAPGELAAQREFARVVVNDELGRAQEELATLAARVCGR